MTKTPEDLDLLPIVDSAIAKYLADRSLTGAVPLEKLPAAEKARLRQAFMPVIWSALPAILGQLNKESSTAEETPEDIFAGFTVPDTLEGLTP